MCYSKIRVASSVGKGRGDINAEKVECELEKNLATKTQNKNT
jgi:hypothetical protein